MRKKFNPFTGTFDFVGAVSEQDSNCVILLNSVNIEATGDLEITDEACIEVKNSGVTFAQRINNTVTVNNNGEMIIDANSEVEVSA